MEENKYYTPSIEEFHIGFEYEMKTPDGWAKYVYGEIHPAMGWMLPINEKSEFVADGTRIKRLDKSDIESCGWTYIPDDSTGDGNFRWCDEFEIIKGPHTHYKLSTMYHLSEPEWEKESERVCITDNPTRKNEIVDRMFNGKIKNKSELKRIMYQIGILK